MRAPGSCVTSSNTEQQVQLIAPGARPVPGVERCPTTPRQGVNSQPRLRETPHLSWLETFSGNFGRGQSAFEEAWGILGLRMCCVLLQGQVRMARLCLFKRRDHPCIRIKGEALKLWQGRTQPCRFGLPPNPGVQKFCFVESHVVEPQLGKAA